MTQMLSRRNMLTTMGSACALSVAMPLLACASQPVNGNILRAATSYRTFGKLEGRDVRAGRLAWPGGISLEVIEYGAIVQSLQVPHRGTMLNVVLGFETLQEYIADTTYQGGVVGRVANRIANGTFQLDGKTIHVTANRKGNCLHGGNRGFNKRLWQFTKPLSKDYPALSLIYQSADQEEGFPGRVDVRITYMLTSPTTLVTAFEARTSAPTPVNLSTHLYFNLSGDIKTPILDHELMIAASAITPVRERLIPTGEILPVAGTPFDFNKPKTIAAALSQSHPQLDVASGLDHNWVLDKGAKPSLSLYSPESGLRMLVTTDQPGIQVYDGHNLKPPFIPKGALAIEPQNFPDAVNHPNFPNSILRPGEVYRATSSYLFEDA